MNGDGGHYGGSAIEDSVIVAVVENVLPDALLHSLRFRLSELAADVIGASSFFVPFVTNTQGKVIVDAGKKSFVEYLILRYLAPATLGKSLEEAVRDGYLGAEWWVQVDLLITAAAAATATDF